MRILLLGTAAIALSGCSWLGLGKSNQQQSYQNYQQQNAYYGQTANRAPVSNCNSGNCLSRWNLEAAIGPEFTTGGNRFVTGDFTNPASAADIRTIGADDAFSTGYRAELGGSYAVSPNRKIIGNVYYANSEGEENLNLGTIGGDQLTGTFSDHTSYGAELGVRQYFNPVRAPLLKSIRPYVQGRVGLARVESIDLQDTTLAGAAFAANDIPFYESDWVGSASGMVGIETPLTKYSTIALETGIRYVDNLDQDNTVLGFPNTLAGINQGGARTTVPLMLRGRYRF